MPHNFETLIDFLGVDEHIARQRIAALMPEAEGDISSASLNLLTLRKLSPSDKDAFPTESDLFKLATVLDDRAAIIATIWDQLGNAGSPPLCHAALARAVFESPPFGGVAANSQSAEELYATIIARITTEGTAEADEFIENGRPTLFYYEAIAARLETEQGQGEEAVSDDAEDDIDDDPEEPATADPVRSNVDKMSVKMLFDYVERKLLDLQPAWQRKDVWSPAKNKKLIESIMLGIPLPSIIIHRHDGKMAIIDGKQRLTAIVKFMRNSFSLSRYTVPPEHRLSECSGAKYSNGRKAFSDALRLHFDMSSVPVLLFEDVPDKRLRQIFHLYNVSSTRLNAAEIRNAIYQDNEIHRCLYALAGEGLGTPDLGTGDLAAQEAFTRDLRRLWRRHQRYVVLDFLCRYMGYSRAAQRVPGQDFRAISTSAAINRYFDYGSRRENASSVAKEIIQAFRTAEWLFDIDDDRLPFHRRTGHDRKFAALHATTNLIASHLANDLLDTGTIDRERAERAAGLIQVPYLDKQQTSTIWDYQARYLEDFRRNLGIEARDLPGSWPTFFEKMRGVVIECDEGRA
jgi:hypothetical protein